MQLFGARGLCQNVPVSWQPEIDEIRRREAIAREMGGAANVERQHAAGRLTVRERIDRLLDPGSFHEIGALAGRAEYDESGQLASFTPSNFIAGTGRIDGRQVAIGGDDFTVRGGAADAAIGNKMERSEKLARGLRVPMVRLVDGTGGGGSVKTIEHIGRTYVPANPAWDTITAMLGEVPVVGACLGPVAGLGAVRVVTSHFSLMVRGSSQLFVAGPPVVERGVGEKLSKEQLGGHEIHARGSGAVDNEVASEDEAFVAIRRFLSYLPSSVWEAPPRVASSDDPDRREEDLISIIRAIGAGPTMYAAFSRPCSTLIRFSNWVTTMDVRWYRGSRDLLDIPSASSPTIRVTAVARRIPRHATR